MRIYNEGKATIFYNGGKLEPRKTIDFVGEFEKVGASLLRAYKFLRNMDELKVDGVVSDKSALVTRAKELGVKGNVDGMKEETLKAKIAELEA